MNTILPKTPLPALRYSMHKIKNRVVTHTLNVNDVDRVKAKDALMFLQSGYSKVILGCTSAFQVPEITLIQKRGCPDAPGSGAEGTGGGSKTGSVGKFGDMNEEQFFYKRNKAQMEQLKLELEKKAQEKSNAPEKKDK